MTVVVGFWKTGPSRGKVDRLDPTLPSRSGPGLFQVSGMNGSGSVVNIAYPPPLSFGLNISAFDRWLSITGRDDDIPEDLVYDRVTVEWSPGFVEDNGMDLSAEHIYSDFGVVSPIMRLMNGLQVAGSGTTSVTLSAHVPDELSLVTVIDGLTVTASIPDANINDFIRVRWAAGGEWVNIGHETSASHTYSTPGVYDIRMEDVWHGVAATFAAGTVTVAEPVPDEEPMSITVEATTFGLWAKAVIHSADVAYDTVWVGWDGGSLVSHDQDLTPEYTFPELGVHTVRIELRLAGVVTGVGHLEFELTPIVVEPLVVTYTASFLNVILQVERPDFYDRVMVNWDDTEFVGEGIDFSPEHIYTVAGMFRPQVQVLWRGEVRSIGNVLVEVVAEQDDPPVDPE